MLLDDCSTYFFILLVSLASSASIVCVLPNQLTLRIKVHKHYVCNVLPLSWFALHFENLSVVEYPHASSSGMVKHFKIALSWSDLIMYQQIIKLSQLRNSNWRNIFVNRIIPHFHDSVLIETKKLFDWLSKWFVEIFFGLYSGFWRSYFRHLFLCFCNS